MTFLGRERRDQQRRDLLCWSSLSLSLFALILALAALLTVLGWKSSEVLELAPDVELGDRPSEEIAPPQPPPVEARGPI